MYKRDIATCVCMNVFVGVYLENSMGVFMQVRENIVLHGAFPNL